MLAIIPFIFTNPWIVAAMNLLITVAFWAGVAYLGGVLFGSDIPETESGPTADAQSRSWDPHSTQSEGIARPRAYGKNMHHGNIVAKWTDVSGDEREVLYMIVEHGDGPTKGIVVTDGVKQVYIDDQPAANFGDVDIQERLGTMDQTCMDGFETTKLEHELNNELVFEGDPIIVTTPNDYFDDIEFTILYPNGLYKYRGDGSRKGTKARHKVRISVHGEDSWTTIFDEWTSAKVYVPLFKLYKVNELGAAVGFRVKRGTQYDLEFTRLNATGGRYISQSQLRSLREVLDIAFTRPGKALVGIRAVATEKLSGRLDVKVIREDKLVWTWNGTTATIEYSRNRSWVVFDALTQPVIDGDGSEEHPWVIQYYEGMDPSRLDLTFFYKWAEFCATQVPDGYGGTEDRLACDTILDFKTDVWTFANEIANIGRAHLYWQGHTLTGWIDTEVGEITDLVTMDNIMARSWKNAWTDKSELAGKAEVFFNDSRQGYERTHAPLPNESAGKYTRIISVEGIGITTRGTAIHVANHVLKRNELIRNVNSFRKPKDAFRYKLGHVVRIQHRTPRWGQAYRVIKSDSNNTVKLDRHCDASAGELIFVRAYDEVKKKVSIDSYTVASCVGKVLTIEETWDVAPVKNNSIAVGAAGVIQTRRITKMDVLANNYWDVTVETYDVALFTADDLDPNNPDQNYIWDRPANPLTRPVTRAEVIELINQLMVPQPDVDSPVTSNCTWTGSGGDTVTWSKTDADDAIIFSYKGTSYEITPDSTTDEFIYWDPNFTTTFRHTNNAAVAVALGKWYMCRNVAGVAYPTTPFSSVHAGVLQVGTITAALGQIGDLAVETLKIANNAVSLGVSAYTDGSAGDGDVQSVEITTTGQPVNITVTVRAYGNSSIENCVTSGDCWRNYTLKLKRDTTQIYTSGQIWFMSVGGQFGWASMSFRDTPGAGTYTYKLNMTGSASLYSKRFLFVQEVKK